MTYLINIKPEHIPWIGSLPTGWKLIRLKWTTNQVKNGIWGDEPQKSDTDIICVRVADFDRTTFRVNLAEPTLRNIPYNQQIGRLLKFGDLLIEKSGGGDLQPVGTVVIYDHYSPAVCSNFIARVEVRQEYNSRFLTYLHAHLYLKRVNTRSIKQTTGIQNLDSQSYFDEFVGLPELKLQQEIASFLDRKTAAIATLIAKKERLIQLLEEKRIALINQAVTKGLNPNVKMEDSRIPCIGEIPEHWKAIQLRRYIRRIEQGWSPVAEDRIAQENEWSVLKLNSVSKGEFHPNEYKVLSENTEPDKRFEVKDGDLLLSRANTPQLVGEACYVRNPPPKLMLCDLLYRLDINERFLNKRFCTYYLLSKSGKAQISADARGTSQSMVKISQGHIKSWIIPLPPSLEEQESIANYLDAQLAFIKNVTNKIIQQINKLQEYRQTLITAAVTGKIDVREEVAV